MVDRHRAGRHRACRHGSSTAATPSVCRSRRRGEQSRARVYFIPGECGHRFSFVRVVPDMYHPSHVIAAARAATSSHAPRVQHEDQEGGRGDERAGPVRDPKRRRRRAAAEGALVD